MFLIRVGFDDPELVEAYIGQNDDSGIVFKVSNLLPSVVTRIFSDIKVHKHHTTIKKKLCLLFVNGVSCRLAPSSDKRADDLASFSMPPMMALVSLSLWREFRRIKLLRSLAFKRKFYPGHAQAILFPIKRQLEMGQTATRGAGNYYGALHIPPW